MVKTKTPKNWFLSGGKPEHYQCEMDQSTFHSGTRSACISNVKDNPEQFATLMRNFTPKEFLGQRVRLSAWMKTEQVKNMAAFWMSVYGAAGRPNVSFDNMCNRKIVGTTDWNRYEIVLDVPPDGTKIGFGAILGGAGRIWIDDFSFEVVGNETSLTDCPAVNARKYSPFLAI